MKSFPGWLWFNYALFWGLSYADRSVPLIGHFRNLDGDDE